jgi:soluble lytic murein transglycosylase
MIGAWGSARRRRGTETASAQRAAERYRPVAGGVKGGLGWALAVPQPKRLPAHLLVLAAALAALACRSPVPPLQPPGAPSTTPGTAAARQPLQLVTPTAPPAPAEEAAEDPILVMLRAVLAARAGQMEEPPRERLAKVLVELEREHDISALLLVALIERESRFDPLAKGPRGSLGLMQVRPFVGRDVAGRIGLPWRGEQTLFDPVANVRIGTAYLAELLDRFGSQELALAAYNIGPTRLARRLARGEVRNPAFVSRVMLEYQGLQQEFAPTETGIGG